MILQFLIFLGIFDVSWGLGTCFGFSKREYGHPCTDKCPCKSGLACNKLIFGQKFCAGLEGDSCAGGRSCAWGYWCNEKENMCEVDHSLTGCLCSDGSTWNEELGTCVVDDCESGFEPYKDDKCRSTCPGGWEDRGYIKKYKKSVCRPNKGKYGRGFGYTGEGKCERNNRDKRQCEKCLLLWYPKCRDYYEPIGCNECDFDKCPHGEMYLGFQIDCPKVTYERKTRNPVTCSYEYENRNVVGYGVAGNTGVKNWLFLGGAVGMLALMVGISLWYGLKRDDYDNLVEA